MSDKLVKVPVILQMEAVECGAASLAMVLAYYKKWIPLEQVRIDCGVSRDGSNAANIVQAAKSYGLEAKARLLTVEKLKENAACPCILWWNHEHFVVLDGFTSKGTAKLNDPAVGRVEVSAEAFAKKYSLMCIELKPGPDFVPGGKRASVFSFLRERGRDNLKALLFVMLAALPPAVTGLLIPQFARIYTDHILSGENPEWLFGFLVLFAALILFQFFAETIRIYSIIRSTGKLSIGSSASFLWHVFRLPLDFFAQRMTGDIASRQSENDKVSNVLVSRIAPTLIQMVLLIFYVVVMVRYSLVLTLVGLFTVVLNLYLVRYISEKQMEISRSQSRDKNLASAVLMNGIRMIETIKAAGAENGFFTNWSDHQASSHRAQVSGEKIEQYLSPLPSLIQQISDVIVLSLGTFLMIRGTMTAGAFLAFQALLSAFYTPANKLLAAGKSIQETRTSMERIEDVLNYPPALDLSAPDPSLLKGAEKLSGELKMENVTFGYSPLAEPLIRDFSADIKPGAMIALVGFSGSGKSTIAKLIAGLYKPWSGSITFDGKTHDEILRPVFTGSVAVVDQDVVLFNDTIASNIKMWDESIADFEMILAARDADMHEGILKRKGAYQHRLEEGGRDLSGGQRQRLEIARALAVDPTIIVMDEATSALDAATEQAVAQSIRARGITCIIVAHRLSTIRDCDEIIVLDHGLITERGTHEKLMEKGGLYSRLVTTE